jgi:eukaryotic-like serine/threonine-protein kinase
MSGFLLEEITGRYVLPADLTIVRVNDLPSRVRHHVDADPNDYALTVWRSRKVSKIVDRQTAELLELFRKPSRIVDVAIAYGRQVNCPPENILESAYPVLEALISARFLVPNDSAEAAAVLASIDNGSEIDHWHVIRCVALVDDTEVYQVRDEFGTSGALKILRQTAPKEARIRLERESEILPLVRGTVHAPLIGSGVHQTRRYLVTCWCDGETILNATADARASGDSKRLLELCISVASAYACLHSQSILHGDVHPQNILVCSDDSVKIIDYGLARKADWAGNISIAQRGGVASFFEPEYAHAILRRVQPPSTSFGGEQYAVAALLYFVFTGAEYIEFSYSRETMMNQILTSPVLPFFHHCINAWPETEAVLRRALCKDPSDRFGSVAEFRDSLTALTPVLSCSVGRSDQLRVVGRETLQELSHHGYHFFSQRSKPLLSVYHGAAGVAYALYRVACSEEDPDILALADAWISKAGMRILKKQDFDALQNRNPVATASRISPYHATSGVPVVDAMIAQAYGDIVRVRSSIRGFISDVQNVESVNDLTLGRSGTLLACTLLFEMLAELQDEITIEIQNLANQILEQVWKGKDSNPSIGYNGMAHGWAGIIYTSLRWHLASGASIPRILLQRLDELADRAEPYGPGLRWRWMLTDAEPTFMSGWCGGTAGLLHLWTLTRLLWGNKYSELAEGAAIYTWENSPVHGSLCCGLAGCAYALMDFYAFSGEKVWLGRAGALAERAAVALRRSSYHVTSLYHGQLASVPLAVDITQPEWSCMPFFGYEGWPRIQKRYSKPTGSL